MSFKHAATLIIGLLAISLHAQQIANLKTPISEVQLVDLPQLDNESLIREELAQREPGRPPRFAESHFVDISPETHGKWETSPAGYAIWRLRVRSANAFSLNLGFDRYYMPEGGRLFLFSPDQSRVFGPFSPADNQEHAQLWTPIVEGDELVIEVQVPAPQRHELQLHLSAINHDFLGFSQLLSGSCNLDVICGAADGWAIVDRYRDIIQSVGLYALNGGTICTGFLINNTRNDCKPYFMTAFHCGVNATNAPTMVVYWNFQNSTCRQPGSPASGGQGNGTLNLFTSGSTLLARSQASDFALVELTGQIPEAANAFFAGWNRSNQTPQDTVIAIHHPSLDEKRISFEFDPTYPGNWGSGNQNIPSGNHIIVPDWDIGTTEGGSSGSPLFNRKKQVVGQLHGGAASCNNNSYDSYGWIFYSWTGGGTPASSLSSWLDPDNTGLTEIDGRAARLCSYSVDALIASRAVCAPDSAVYPIVISENFEDTVTLAIAGLPAGAQASFTVNPVPPGDTVLLVLTNTAAITPGTYTMTVSGSDGINQGSSVVSLLVNAGMPDVPALLSPDNGLVGASIAPNFSWAPQQTGTRYFFQLATDPGFNNIVGSVNDLNANSVGNQVLIPNTTYYWRVRGTNLCGEGPWSEVRSLTTAITICSSRQAGGLPLVIPSQGTPTVNSTINFSAPGVVAGVKITGLDIRHSWVGDIRATLISPQGTSVVLFDRLGVPATQFGCQGDNLLLSFEDVAPNTAAQLENTCNTTPPAASGNFQPVDPFITLAGEPASGQWTLRINDFVNQDGGSLQAWALEICTSLPNEANLFPAATEFTACLADTVTFQFGVGTGFNAPGVNIEIQGLPPGAQYAFSSALPANPGQIITARIWGFEAGGVFNATLSGASGSQTAIAPLTFNINSPLAAAAPLAPAPGAVGVSRNPTLTWGAVPGATAYRLWVAKDSLLTELVANPVLTATSFALANLDFATRYYWRVDAQNECGWSQATAPARFTTLGDLSFSANPSTLATCNTGMATYTLNLGAGYFAPLAFSFTSTGSGAVLPELVFDTTNNQRSASVSNLLFLARGTYQMNVIANSADGGMGNVNLTLIVETAPVFTTLSAPANGATVTTQTPALSWTAVPGADNYRIEIARDENFNDVVLSQLVTQISLTVAQLLAPGNYYWRVTSINECGNATTAPFRFTVMPNTVYEWAGLSLRIDPNPTPGPVHILTSGPVPVDLRLALFHIDGTLMYKRIISKGETSAALDLSAYPPGVYVLHIGAGQSMLTHRIVKQ